MPSLAAAGVEVDSRAQALESLYTARSLCWILFSSICCVGTGIKVRAWYMVQFATGRGLTKFCSSHKIFTSKIKNFCQFEHFTNFVPQKIWSYNVYGIYNVQVYYIYFMYVYCPSRQLRSPSPQEKSSLMDIQNRAI